jgi:phage protein U
MFAQLGDIIFEGPFGFNSYEAKGSVNYAQHDLINAKPILKPTGGNLDELTLEIRLRAEFVDPTQAILALEKSRDDYEILPLLKGTGQYEGDFVITEITKSYVHALPDGTLIEAVLQLSLLEYVTGDKLQQQQTSARKRAFALGDKKPVALNIEQQHSIAQLAAGDLSEVHSEAALIDREVSQYENNTSRRQSIAGHIQRGLQKMDDALQTFNDRLNEITILDDIQSIVSVVAVIRQTITQFTFPITSIPDLQDNNRDLQNLIRAMGSSTAQLINLVITRAA